MSDCEKKKEEKVEGELDDSFKISAWGVRHNQCLLLFFTLTTAYSMRACMGVALVAMVQDLLPTHNHVLNETIDNLNLTKSLVINATEDVNDDNFHVNGFFNALLITPPFPNFHWPKKVQDAVLSAFFWGYMLLQIPGGQLAHRFGARYLLVGAMTLNCLIALILPVASYYGGWICTLLCRMAQGLSQASILPSFHTILGKWSPVEERGRMSSIIYGGQALGTVLGLPITGFIASSSLGWPGIFRFYGLLSGTVALVLWFLLSDTPALHKSISPAERQYIEEALGQTGEKKKLPVPWKKILLSRGMIAIVVAHTGNTWGQLILFTEVPAYMDKVMGVNIKANGLLTALPFMFMFFSNFFFCWISDMLIMKKYLSVTNARKLANSVGSIGACIGLIAVGYAPKNMYVVETLLVLVCIFKVATHAGFHVNHVDIAPNFAGTMMSISNFMSNLVGSQAPMIAGAILTDVTDDHKWRIVFFITAALYFFSNVVYVILGTGELAEWNDPPQYETVALRDPEDVDKKIKSKEESEGENGTL